MIGKREKSLEEREEAWKEEWYHHLTGRMVSPPYGTGQCRLCKKRFKMFSEGKDGYGIQRIFPLRRHWRRFHCTD